MRIDGAADLIRVESESEAETDRLGRALAAAVVPGTVVGLTGPLGAGKTRLSRAIAEALGASPQAISSPTYVLIHEYEARLPVSHFDAYRLPSPEAFDALGADEYFAGDGVCLVEWADRVADRLPRSAWWIAVDRIGEGRAFTLKLDPSAARTVLAALGLGQELADSNSPAALGGDDPGDSRSDRA